jgi:MFS family permease
MGIFLSADWALMADIVPPEHAGRYMGLSNTVTAGSALLAVALGGPLADLVNGWHFGLGYRAIFLLAAVEFVIGAACVRRVHEAKMKAG